MKSALLFLVFAVAATQAAHICLSDVFTTRQVSFLPEEKDILESKTWYSVPLQKTRTDYEVIIIDDKYTAERVSFIFDVPAKKFYRIEYFNSTAKCEVHDLHGDLPEICLAKDAERRGEYTLGGSLLVENFAETFHTQNDTAIRVDVAMAKNVNVPVRVATRDSKLGIRIEEFWDWKDSVNHDAFLVPSVCHSKLATIGKQSRSIGEVQSSFHPLSKNSFLFRNF